ncbi:receptor-like protein kinase FERONIA [Amaranthus tricolor]|uniref:receptor-like protein kinase FERONIA n=1 Tax=Amaranthus tricolor TaxID=29722 RepID=UPI00258B8E2B|nr:receptor-like protein kinase FERONIA [Amaranthus tricolor]
MGRIPFIILWLSVLVNVIVAQNYTPKDIFLLDCGATDPHTTDSDGRKWSSDNGSKFLSSPKGSTTATAATQLPDVGVVPFMTARIFQSKFTYNIPVASGRKFVRLYFYPNTYSGRNTTNAIFSVTSGPYTLLSNFSAAQTTEALNYDYLIKEYSLNVEGTTLSLTFTPSSNYTNSFAFVNGIEVVSMPNVYSDADTDGAIMVGGGVPFPIDNSTALEGLYRLNVGGNYIPPTQDTGLFRAWSDDTPYIFGAASGTTSLKDPEVNVSFPSNLPSYTAPVNVYSTARFMTWDNKLNLNFNLTWLFTVDTGFSYMVRLHFCEIFANITKPNQIVFNIYINNQTAASSVDVIALATSNGVPNVQDYVVMLPTSKDPQQDLWLALYPDTFDKPQYYNSFLNGVEIFKINSTTGNLAGQNPVPAPDQDIDLNPSATSHSSSHAAAIGGAVAGGVGLIFLVGLLACFVSRRRKYGKVSNPSDGPSGWRPLSLYGNSHTSGSAKTTTTGSYTSSLPSNLCRHFSFAEIKSATKNFDESLVLGVGGFGKVYRGEIDNGTMKVAIKRGNPLSDQGVHEFQTEIEMLSKLRHRHLVSLLGYCEENGEMILVYDYMAYGTLREHLYKTQKPPLPWKQRLEICIGAARGLHYLHTGAKHTIIHRDVKTTNILLDEKWVAKVSDFGLSKTGPSLDHTHVSTVVKGSFGYLDPEYFRRQQLTDKSDVYSFGVVLFEILCARPALNPSLPKEQVSLAEWAVYCYKKGMLDQIMDPYLKGKIAPECFKKFAETAMKCVSDQSIDRPSMGDVLWNLEFTLQLQESAEESGKGVGGVEFVEGKYDIECGKKDLDESRGLDGNATDSRSTMSIGGQSLASTDSDGLTPSAVFSQIMNPKGR